MSTQTTTDKAQVTRVAYGYVITVGGRMVEHTDRHAVKFYRSEEAAQKALDRYIRRSQK